MSGVQFAETLRCLSYPNVENLVPQGLDWMFENEAILPFLEWFCNNISSSNLLDPRDVHEFHVLEESPEGVLEGRQLDEAVQNILTANDDSANEETLIEDIKQLTDDLQKCNNRKQILLQKRNKFSLHLTGLRHRIGKLGELESGVKSVYRRSLEQTQADNTELSRNMEMLSQSVSHLHSMYQELPSSNEPKDINQPSLFLSQLTLQEFYGCEERYTQELTAYTKKQFFEGIAEMSGQAEGSRYELLEVSDPDLLLIRGEREEIGMNDCSDLARLLKFFPKNESLHINAKINSHRVSQSLNEADSMLQSLQLGGFGTETTALSQRLHETKSALHAVRRDLAVLAEKEVPALIHESAVSQVIPILTGDYNLKLARQDYFTSNQGQVIDYLVQQRARNEFLTMAYEVEARGHRDIHRLLTAVSMLLEAHIKCRQDRMSAMDDTAMSQSRHHRETLDTRDRSTARLHQMLVEEDRMSQDHHLFHTHAEFIEGAEKLQQKRQAMDNALVAMKDKHEDRIHVLEQTVQNCEEMIYAGSSTTSGQPSLTPRQIRDSMLQLEDMLKKLEHTIMELRKGVDSKKKTIKNESLLARERNLLTYFFIHPNKLQESIDEISSRLQSQRVQ
ncbi:hypothetical protein ScPMuIL_001149 [Solemya velum]